MIAPIGFLSIAHRVIHVCLKSCGRKSSIFAALHAFSKDLRIETIGLPWRVNTLPDRFTTLDCLAQVRRAMKCLCGERSDAVRATISRR